MKSKTWIAGWLVIVISMIVITCLFVYKIDPYFHYHKPNTEDYYYDLNNQRSQNDGIIRHFDYDAIITGTSMTENFRTSEINEMFGVNSIKIPYEGASYKEINDSIRKALENNNDLKMVIRGIDSGLFFDDPDRMREDLGDYPTYLYDDNPLNDVEYLLNRDVVLERSYAMEQESNEEDFTPGITDFDYYSVWQDFHDYGVKTVLPDGIAATIKGDAVHMTQDEKNMLEKLVNEHIVSLADEYKDMQFYYFFTPYSITWYKDLVDSGEIYRQIEAEQYIIEQILKHDNIKLFSFNAIADIVTDLNNYRDRIHYASWINSLILRYMSENTYLLTEDNYKEYLNNESDLYINFDYESLNEQIDYTDDNYSAALFNETIWKEKPIDVMREYEDIMELSNAEIIKNQYEDYDGIRCRGCYEYNPEGGDVVDGYIANIGYIGANIHIDNIGRHNYMVLYGKKVAGAAQPTIIVLDENGNKVGEVAENWQDIDNEWQQYIVNMSNVEGSITVILNGGGIDATQDPNAEYIFSKIFLY